MWSVWLTRLIEEEGVTDIVYYGDRQPYHRAARAVAMERGIKAHAVEFGYLRPGWLTLERGGMSAFSHFPADPAVIRQNGSGLAALPKTGGFGHHWLHEATHEIIYNITNLLYAPIFRNYAPDLLEKPYKEYLSGVAKLWRGRKQRSRYEAVERLCLEASWPMALYALQLQTDWQIRANSPIADQRDSLDHVISSLARSAPADMRLLVKLHPLDSGRIDWEAEVAEIARRHGVGDRVLFLDGGNLDALLRRSHGAIVINSTVGLQALRMGFPVKVLGVAVYDLPGLTHQGSLESFWHSPDPVDTELRVAFVRLLAASTQVPGSFYNRKGRAVAVKKVADRLAMGRVNEPNAFVTPPPRLARARRMGIPVDSADVM
ncbi:MAG: capsular biosynthesis protein [Pseudomonadota bacterium]